MQNLSWDKWSWVCNNRFNNIFSCSLILWGIDIKKNKPIKYTPEGGTIGLSLEAVFHPKENELQIEDIFAEGYVEINVEDNGIGIPSKSWQNF